MLLLTAWAGSTITHQPGGADPGSRFAPVAEPATDDPHPGRIPPGWWRHVVALGAILVAFVPLFSSGDIASPDEGLYSAQAAALVDGSWWAERPAPGLDPDGSMDPLRPGAVDEDEHLPYSRHPLYPLLLAPLYALGGSAAMLLLSVAGTLAAATATSLLAGRLQADLVLPALWVTGLGSPLVFDASLVMAHAPAVGAAAWMLVATTRAVDDGRTVWLGALVPLGVLTAMLRSEGVIVVAATGVATAGVALLRPRRDLRAIAIGVSIVGLAGATHLLDEHLAARIARGSMSGSSFDRRSSVWNALWNDLAVPWTRDATDMTVTVVLAAVFGIIGLALLRARLPSSVLPASMLLIAAAAALARHLEAAPGNISGLVPAFPLLVGGLLCLRREQLAVPLAGRSVLLAAATTIGIAATSYGAGGVTQWGGRFFHVLLPAVIPLALGGLHRAVHHLARPTRLVVVAASVVLVGSHSVLALRANHHVRANTDRILGELATVAPDASTATDRTVTLWLRLSDSGDTRMAWREVVAGRPLLSVPRPEVLQPALERARDDVERIEVFSHLSPELATAILEPPARRTGWEVVVRPSTPGGYTHLRMVPSPGP